MQKYTHAKLRFQAWNTLYQAWRKRYLAGAIAAVLASLGGPALAAPMGAEFLKGAGNVSAAGSATTVNITAADATRARASALINWKGGFNISAAESVHFNNALPTAGKLSVYNVDNTGSVSVIDGALTSSTGARATTVHLINPVGVAIGATANINVGGGFTAMAGSVATENCTTLPCVPVVYADGMQVEVSLTGGSINVSPASSIVAGGSWDFTELNTLSTDGTLVMSAPAGVATLPYGKYSGSAPTDGVVDLQDSFRPLDEDFTGQLSWMARDTAVSSTKYSLPPGNDLTMDNATIDGAVSINWGGAAGNVLLRDVQVTDTTSRSAALDFVSYLVNPDASVRIESLLLDATHGFGATLNVANLLLPVDHLTATGMAGVARPALVMLDSQVRSPVSAQGSMDVAVGTRSAGLPTFEFDNAGFNRAADNRLAIDLGKDVTFKLTPDIGSADYTVANVDITGGKSVAIANINTPPSSGVGVSTGLLRIDGVTVQGTGDMSIKSGTTGLVMTSSDLSGSGMLDINTKGIEYSDISFGGSLNAEAVNVSFDKGINFYAFEDLAVSNGNLATTTGDITVGNQYRSLKMANLAISSDTGNVTMTGSIGRMDVTNVQMATGGDVAISNHALASGSVRQELALVCPTADSCTFDGVGQVGQLHMGNGTSIAANKVTVSGENVHLQGTVINAADDVLLSAANQLQIMELSSVVSTSQVLNSSVTMAANVLIVEGAYSSIGTETARLQLNGTSVMRVEGLHFQSVSGDFIVRTENSDIDLDNSTAWTAGSADVFTRTGQVTMHNVGVQTMGKGNITVQAGKNIAMTGTALAGEASIAATSNGGSIGLDNSQIQVIAGAKYDPMNANSVYSGIALTAANGAIGMLGSNVIWDPTFYAQDANGNYPAQEGSGTALIGAPLGTAASSGLFADKALHVAGTHHDDGTHVNVWTGEASPIKTTAASTQSVVSIKSQALNMDGSLVVVGKNLPAATLPVVTPPVVVPPVVVPEPPVVVPPVVVPEPPVVVVPPVVVPEPPVVVVPPVVTPEPPVVVLPPVVPPVPPVAPPTTVPPAIIPVVVVSTRVEVADVAGPTMRADTVYVPGPGGQSRGVEVHSEPARVEVDEKDKR